MNTHQINTSEINTPTELDQIVPIFYVDSDDDLTMATAAIHGEHIYPDTEQDVFDVAADGEFMSTNSIDARGFFEAHNTEIVTDRKPNYRGRRVGAAILGVGALVTGLRATEFAADTVESLAMDESSSNDYEFAVIPAIATEVIVDAKGGILGYDVAYGPVEISDSTGDTEIMTSENITNSEIAWMPEAVARFAPLMAEAATEQRLDGEFIPVMSIIARMETGGDPNAVSPVGARGLGQIMPHIMDTLIERGVVPADVDPFDPKSSVTMQAYLMNEMGNGIKQLIPEAPTEVHVAALLANYNGGIDARNQVIDHWKSLPANTSFTDTMPTLVFKNGEVNGETDTYMKRGVRMLLGLNDQEDPLQ